jgi:hypothetical protein
MVRLAKPMLAEAGGSSRVPGMTRTLRLTLAAFALAPSIIALAAPAAVAAPAVDPAYDRLFDALEGSPAQRELAADNTLDAIIDGLAKALPPIGEAMQANPSMRQEMRDGLSPTIRKLAEDTRPALRAAMLPVLVKGLTPAEARELGTFYASPLGGRLMSAALASYNPQKTVADALDGGKVGGQSVSDDMMAAGFGGLAALSDDDRAKVIAFAMTPAATKYRALLPELAAARAAVENAPPTPELEAKMAEVLYPIFDKYLTKNESGTASP